jgi:hypothetical protein
MINNARARNVAASKKNGAAANGAKSQLPRSGPANWFVAISAPNSRPFARASCERSTMAGINTCAATSAKTSPAPAATDTPSPKFEIALAAQSFV